MTRPTSDRDRVRAAARSRALAILAERYPDEYRSLYRAELLRSISAVVR